MNDLTVLKHITNCDQNMPPKVPERNESHDMFGANECVCLITLWIPTTDN